MAARNNDQTLKAALVVFVGFTVVLLAFLVYVNRLRADHLQEVQGYKSQQGERESTARRLIAEDGEYRAIMGFTADEKFDEVKGQFEKDRTEYMNNYPEEDQNYRTVMIRLDSEITRSTEQEVQAKEREKELKERLLRTEAEKDAQIKKFQATLKKVETDAATERNLFNEAREKLKAKEQEALAAIDRQRKAHEAEVAELNKQISELDSQLVKVTRSRDRLKNERERGEPSFEISDGRIAWVNQANGTVWINLGSADSLRRQVTFSVYEQSASDAGKADKKASIEVTRMLSDHMAEARITSDDARNPILPGDWIYSPLWHRGKQIHFAMTGVLDLNGDGRPDLQQAKDLIALNDGVLDASVKEDGSFDGEMTVETRYLVLGDFPNLPSQSELRASYAQMSKDAKDLGVETITLQEFLNQMGYKPLDKTVTLGKGSRAEDFQAKPSQFRPRSPYSAR